MGELDLTGSTKPTRWVTDTAPGHSQWYIDRFRNLAADGTDLAGEARLIDAMVTRNARILDAGCGPGRVGAELAARGHTVVGVDADPALIEAAIADHPGARWLVADLSELDLAAHGEPELFDAAVIAGNVMTFVAPGTEAEVLRRVGAHVRPGGAIVVGFAIDRGYPLADFDRDIVAAGLVRENRFATWDLVGWQDDADFAVTVLRTTPDSPDSPNVGSK
jgi:SAM-dependent methyltransferase